MQDLEKRLFTIGMWWRVGYGLLRIVFGLALLKVVGLPFLEVITKIMSHELLEDPNDLLYGFVSNLLKGHQLYVTYFLSAYFVFWGIVDSALSYSLIKHKLWAFPVSFVFIGAFVVYEIIRFIHTHSFVLLWLVFVDLLILWLMCEEYMKLISYKK